MRKILGILAGAGFILGLTLTPTVFAADTDHSTQHDSVAKEGANHSSNHDGKTAELGEVEKDHSLVSENEKEEHEALHEDHESSVAEAHESPTAEIHDSGTTVDRHAGSR